MKILKRDIVYDYNKELNKLFDISYREIISIKSFYNFETKSISNITFEIAFQYGHYGSLSYTSYWKSVLKKYFPKFSSIKEQSYKKINLIKFLRRYLRVTDSNDLKQLNIPIILHACMITSKNDENILSLLASDSDTGRHIFKSKNQRQLLNSINNIFIEDVNIEHDLIEIGIRRNYETIDTSNYKSEFIQKQRTISAMAHKFICERQITDFDIKALNNLYPQNHYAVTAFVNYLLDKKFILKCDNESCNKLFLPSKYAKNKTFCSPKCQKSIAFKRYYENSPDVRNKIKQNVYELRKFYRSKGIYSK